MGLYFVLAWLPSLHFAPHWLWCAGELWDKTKEFVNDPFIDGELRRYCHWFFTGLIAIRICGAIPSVHKMNFKLQWLVYSIIIYFLRLFIPFMCLLYLSIACCRKEHNSPHPLNTTTSFTFPNEFTDQEDEHLVIRQGMKIPSKNYKSIFEGNSSS